MNTSRQKTWFITGVSSGLGQSLARRALAQGDIVAGTTRNSEDKSAFEAIAPGHAHGFLLDVTETSSIGQIVGGAEQVTSGIDVLVNNAGYCLVGAVEEASLDEIRRQFEVNVFGTIGVIQAVLPFMRKRRSGHIVNISSISGLATWAGTGIYCASKFALEGATQTLAQEVAGLGIKVTNVEPGGLRTDFGGRSLHHTQALIDDYAETAHNSRRLIAENLDQEPNDPDKAAAAIMKAVEADNPPLHLLLGADAMHYVGQKLGSFQTELADWAPVTVSVTVDDVKS